MVGINPLLLVSNEARMLQKCITWGKKYIKNQIFSASNLKINNVSLSVWKHEI